MYMYIQYMYIVYIVRDSCCVCRTRRIRNGPSDGGDGGSGGGVVLLAENAVPSLSGLKPHYRGRNGERGRGGYRLGGTGRTSIIKVNWWLCTTHACVDVDTVEENAE